MIRFRGERPAYDDTIILTAANNPLTPEIAYTSQKIPQRAGILSVDKSHNARTIELTFELNGKSPLKNAALAWKLAKWAESDVDGQLVFDEQPDRYYLAMLTSIGAANYASPFPEVTLTFTCANPYGFSMTDKTANVGQSFIYGGDVMTWPIITWKPTANAASAQWTDGTHIMRIEDTGYTLASGHTFMIDNVNRLVTDNGQSIMNHVTLLSDWLVIKRGQNTITGTGGTVEWKEVYL